MFSEGTEPGLEATEYFDEDSSADALSADAEGTCLMQNWICLSTTTTNPTLP